jgi:CubicO group peptidase (beta-lactamase class C family)
LGSGTEKTYRRLTADASAAEKRLPAAITRSMLQPHGVETFSSASTKRGPSWRPWRRHPVGKRNLFPMTVLDSSLRTEKVQAALDSLITSGLDRGAQFAVYFEGELVIDLCAGLANALSGEMVEEDTLFPVFSVTKGVSATVIHRLAEAGRLSYDLLLADVWPEFAQAGKERLTLRHALRHLAGLPGLPEELTFAQMLDWEAACAAVARAKPRWEPGRQFAYHAKTYGWLVGETARRVDGRSFTQMVQDEVARPLGVETLHVGLPEPARWRKAFLEESELGPKPVPNDATLAPLPAATVPGYQQMNSPALLAACLPSSNGMMNARALARHYAALLPGGVDGVELLPASRVAKATTWETYRDPAGEPAIWGLGYTRTEIPWKGRTIEGFGHGGYGGSMGFAFPEARLAIGYTRNRLGPETGWAKLVAALSEK